MATKSDTVKLNLVISAKDDAKKVFESFASSIAKTMESVAKNINDSLNLSETLTRLTEDVAKINESLDKINAAKAGEDVVKGLDPMLSELTKINDGFDKLTTAVTDSMDKVSTSVQAGSDKVVTALNKENEALNKIKKGFDFVQLQMAGQMMQSFGQKVTGFFGTAIQQAADFDQNVQNVAGSLRAQGNSAQFVSGHIDQIRQTLLSMGAQGYFSANQVADAMNTMTKQGISYQTIMGGALQAASNVAAANQEDLTKTSNVISDIVHEMGGSLITQYGNMGNAMSHVGDAMTVALHNSRLSMDDFLNTMKYAGPQASGLGVSFTDLAGAIATLGEHGIKGTQAGTTLRRMLTNLTPASKAAATEMKNLGMITADGSNVFYDASGKMKSLADVQAILHDKLSGLSPEMQQFAIKTIFGQYALSGMTALVHTTPKAFADMTAAMNKSGTAQQILAEKQQGLGFQLQKAHAAYQTMMKAIGEMFVPVVSKLASVFDEVAQAVIKFTTQHPMLAKMVAIGTAIAGVAVLIAGVFTASVAGIGMFVGAITDVADGFAALDLSISPVVLIIGGVIAVIAGLYIAWKHNFLGIRDITHTVWTAIKTAVKSAVDFFKPYIMNAVSALQKFWNQVWPEIKQVFSEVWSVIKAIYKPYIDFIREYLKFTMAILSAMWKDAWNAIKDILKAVWDVIVNVIKVTWDIVSGVIKIGLDLLTGHWGKAWNDMKTMLKNVWNDIKSLFVDFGKDMLGFGTNMVKMLADGIMAGIHFVENAAKSVINKVKGLLGFHSPTKEGPGQDSDTWMPNMMRMFQRGVNDNLPNFQVAMHGVANVIQQSIAPNPSNVASSVRNYSNTVNNYLTPAMSSGRGSNVNVNISMNGGTTDPKQLAEQLAKTIRQQMAVVSA